MYDEISMAVALFVHGYLIMMEARGKGVSQGKKGYHLNDLISDTELYN